MKDPNIHQETNTNKKSENAVLIFPDGNCFYGHGIGNEGTVIGEICFNTSITGYQEILTDPSYLGQIINFTFPHIGNVGTNNKDIEANSVKACGLITSQSITSPSNYRSNDHFNSWLKKNNLIGISGIDTRQITKIIRLKGAKTVAIIHQKEISSDLIQKTLLEIRKSPDLTGIELASKASENKNYSWEKEGKWLQSNNSYNKIEKPVYRVVAIDYGAKLNILRCLTEVGCEVKIVPAKTTFEEIMNLKPSGVFLSNGPGDPAETAKYATPVIKQILQNKIPLFGICLGHQLLALSVGATTSKMHQGHRGANHPVQNLSTKKVEITSQNHGFCVDRNSIPSDVEITHISLFDNSVEGIRLKNQPAFSVQYHPESSPGPSDSFYLFNEFIDLMSKSSK